MKGPGEYRCVRYDMIECHDKDGGVNGYYCEIYFPGPNQTSCSCGPDRVELVIDEWISKYGNPQFVRIGDIPIQEDTFLSDCAKQDIGEILHTFQVGPDGEAIVHKDCGKLEKIKDVFDKWGIKYIIIDHTNLNDVLFG